jgi:hypothetical protein
MPGKAPILKLESFPLKIAAWENEHTANGKTFKTYSVKLVKVYKDDRGQWQETQSLNDRDLLAAASLLLEIWRTLCVKEGKIVQPSTVDASVNSSADVGEHPF